MVARGVTVTQAIDALASIAELGTAECQAWRLRIFARHPWLSKSMATHYRKHYERDGLTAANTWLREFEGLLKIGGSGVFCDATDEQLRSYAENKSKKTELYIHQVGGGRDYRAVIHMVAAQVQKAGVEFPLDAFGEFDKAQAVAALARVCDPRWWRRQMRKLAARQLEHVCRRLGMVSARKASYVSGYSLARRQQQKQRNRQLLLTLDAVNEAGERVNLAVASEKSVSNPVNRRHELMTRLRGYEECAQATGFVAQFYTLTCPSQYHATLHNGQINPKYNGTTPAQAQAYLCEQWAKIRAAWQRRGIRVFGFRIAEPHHDGTPHWHLLLFIAPDRAEDAAAIFGRYALEVDEHEPGASHYRWTVVEIDPNKGSAVGYVAKYVSKNIDGHGMAGERDMETGDEISDSAQRVEAWAGIWGIRQFQQIGSASVTVWRELRRLRDPIERASLSELEAIRAACDAGDWKKFVELMGGPLVKRADLPVRALQVRADEMGPPRPDQLENQYGEICRRLMGVVMRGAVRHITRIHRWTIEAAEDQPEPGAQFEHWAAAVYRGPPEPDRRALDLCQ